MAGIAVAPHNYDAIIETQQKRILELEADLKRYTEKIRLIKTRATESHQAAITAAASVAAAHANAQDYARAHAARVHAMMTMSAVHPLPHALPPHMPMLPASPRIPVPPNTPDVFGVPMRAPAGAPPTSAQTEDDERAGKTRYWTEMEHNQFLFAVKLYGPKNYVAISQFVGTRSPKQVRTHAQKYQMRLEREAKKRRAQAAAMSAVTVPGAAAVAAAVACTDPRMSGMAAGMVNGYVEQEASMGSEKLCDIELGEGRKPKTDSEAAQSASTCPTVTEERKVEEMDVLRESACSPVSNDSDGDVGADENLLSSEDSVMQQTAAAVAAATPVALGGLKKNASLGNLADYDDFMRRITSAVQDNRVESEVIFENTSSDLEMDILQSSTKNEQFEDSLLADL